jgi:long-chain acyl-CoA synthetase
MTNIADFPWLHGETAGDRVAVRSGRERWTYRELRDRIAAFGGAARASGVRPGDRVLLVAPSVPEFPAAYYGLHAAGAAVVAVNPMATVSEIEYVLRDAGCVLAVAWHSSAAATEAAASALDIPFWSLQPQAPASDAAPLARPHASADEDTALILYTSGTTGRPKGAELTHANLIACAETFTNVLRVTRDDRLGTALPLFHVFGGAVVMGTSMVNGASLSLLPRFDAGATLDMIKNDQLTMFFGVPTMYNALLQEVDEPADLSSVRLCASGGASLPEQVLREFNERFGVSILEGYGLTETTGAATFNGLDRHRKAGAVGIPLPGIEVRIVDDQGEETPAGDVGEVILRGPTVMKGYHNRPEATADAIRDGWFHSGDLGTRDVDGDIRIVDRKKDLVIRGGYNVYPREVEEVLYQHRDVVEAAVVGIPDDRLGEEVAAAIALRPGVTLSPQELRTWAEERLSAYKVPRQWVLMDELPKGATGKILKRAIDIEKLARRDAARTTATRS